MLRGVEKMQLMLRIGGRPNDVLGIREQVMLKAGLSPGVLHKGLHDVERVSEAMMV